MAADSGCNFAGFAIEVGHRVAGAERMTVGCCMNYQGGFLGALELDFAEQAEEEEVAVSLGNFEEECRGAGG